MNKKVQQNSKANILGYILTSQNIISATRNRTTLVSFKQLNAFFKKQIKEYEMLLSQPYTGDKLHSALSAFHQSIRKSFSTWAKAIYLHPFMGEKEATECLMLLHQFGLSEVTQYLIIRNFNLTTLPSVLKHYVNLKFIDLQRNQFKYLPISLLQFPKLEYLDLDGNPMSVDFCYQQLGQSYCRQFRETFSAKKTFKHYNQHCQFNNYRLLQRHQTVYRELKQSTDEHKMPDAVSAIILSYAI